MDWFDDVVEIVRDQCEVTNAAVDWGSEANYYSIDLLKIFDEDEELKMDSYGLKSYLFIGYLYQSAAENAKSIYEIALTAGLKWNATNDYAVTPIIDHESYYEESGVESCTYTESINTKLLLVLSIVFGLIGGVVSVMGMLIEVSYKMIKHCIIA